MLSPLGSTNNVHTKLCEGAERIIGITANGTSSHSESSNDVTLTADINFDLADTNELTYEIAIELSECPSTGGFECELDFSGHVDAVLLSETWSKYIVCVRIDREEPLNRMNYWSGAMNNNYDSSGETIRINDN